MSASRSVVVRIIGVVAILVLAGDSAFGHFVVQPMKMVVPATPGRRIPLELVIENTSRDKTEDVSVRIVDITQDANGVWKVIEPDVKVDTSRLRSCQSWLRLLENRVELRPTGRVPVHLVVDVPVGTRGYYCAALLAQALMQANEMEGMTAPFLLEFVIPVIINVQGRPMPREISLTSVGLEFRSQTMDRPAATLASVGVKNAGGTYSLLKTYARLWGKFAGHWRKIRDIEYPSDISIIPGVEFNLKQDVERALAPGEYKIEAFLVADGSPVDQMTREFEFKDDTRAKQQTGVDIALDLDPRELVMQVGPNQSRSESILVVNASEETVNVTVDVNLPEHMEYTVVDNIRGDQFSCTDWLKVTPAQFTLQGRQRTNLRVVCGMPGSGATQPNYYATIKLHATYPDGQDAGKTSVDVCISNKTAQGMIRVVGYPLSLAELSPGRYMVTARFGNFGDTHIQPSCQGVVTRTVSNQVEKKFILTSVQTGVLLPLETRNYSGVLDVAGLPVGTYRLTAGLMHDKGEPVQSQLGFEVIATDEGKMLRQIEIAGGPVKIAL